MQAKIALQLDPTPRNARNSEASFVTLRSGRILLVWSKFNTGNNSDFGPGVIAARYSDDGGLTWSRRDEVVVPNEGSTNVMSPSLLRLQDGRIALLYLRKDGHDRCLPYIRFSRDEAQSFSPPLCILPVPGYYVVNNDRMIQLRSGRLLVPVAMHRFRLPSEIRAEKGLPGDDHTRPPRPLEPFLGSPGLIFFYFSDDGGRTWLESLGSYYHCGSDGHGLQEPGVVELKDGRIWSWTRTGHIAHRRLGSRQWEAFSRDGGQTWTAPRPSQFVSPCSPMQVKRIPATGDLLAVWNDHSGRFKVPRAKPISWGRTPLVLAVSSNEGRTWKLHKLIESAPDHGFCYPAIHFTDRAALLSYNAGGASSKMPLDTQRVRWIPLEAIYRRG
jgi:hypothetical protein